MNILHVIPAIAARYGGPSVVVLETCQGLVRRGHSVIVATTDADGPSRLKVPLGEVTTYQGTSCIFFERTSSEAFKWSPKLARWLDAMCGRFDVVDVHAIFSHSSLVAGRACRHAGVPYVVRPHGSLDPWSLERKRVQKRLLFWLGARRLLTGAAGIQYTTAEEQRLAEAFLPWLTHGFVVPLGIAGHAFARTPAVPSSPPYLLTMSRLESKKGLERLITAFHEATVMGRGADWRLVIAGDGDAAHVRHLKHVAATGHAASRILFPGWVTGAEKTRLLRGAAVFACPSAQENFGVSVVEAMASGVPVLVSQGVNLAPDINAANAGWVVDPAAPSFARVLESVLGDRPGQTTRGKAAAQLARRFGWDQSLDALVTMYRSVQAPRGGGVAA
ncbi:MAG: glycosyltransferase [Acidobacteriota bacterium]